MSQADLRRVQADLETMRDCLGLRIWWTKADVWLSALLAAACALFAAFRWPGSPLAIPMPWAAAPLYAAIAVILGFMAVKWRTLPPREASRKREYRHLLAAMACTLIATLGYQYWGRQAGLNYTQQAGALFTILGLACTGWALLAPTPLRYPRGYYFACGIPLAICGMAFPLLPQEYFHAAFGLMGFVGAAAQGLVMSRRIRQMEAEEQASVLD
jgi:hypothetical protein